MGVVYVLCFRRCCGFFDGIYCFCVVGRKLRFYSILEMGFVGCWMSGCSGIEYWVVIMFWVCCLERIV